MRIVILGAGQVGASVAEALSSEANDITIVDQNRDALAELADRYDVRTLAGNASSVMTLCTTFNGATCTIDSWPKDE